MVAEGGWSPRRVHCESIAVAGSGFWHCESAFREPQNTNILRLPDADVTVQLAVDLYQGAVKYLSYKILILPHRVLSQKIKINANNFSARSCRIVVFAGSPGHHSRFCQKRCDRKIQRQFRK